MDPNGPYEGRAHMREVTRAEFDAYRRAAPDGDWNISTPVGKEGPERYFIPDSFTDAYRRSIIEHVGYAAVASGSVKSMIRTTAAVGIVMSPQPCGVAFS